MGDAGEQAGAFKGQLLLPGHLPEESRQALLQQFLDRNLPAPERNGWSAQPAPGTLCYCLLEGASSENMRDLHLLP